MSNKTTVVGDISVELDQEGQGRYTAFVSRPGKGRMRIGTVLGGHRRWTAEPIGTAPPIHGPTRLGVARRLADWSLTQPGGLQMQGA